MAGRAHLWRWIHQHRTTIYAFIGTILVWELLGRLGFGRGVWPPMTAIIAEFFNNLADIQFHLGATLRNATLGFVIGNLVGVGLAILFVVLPLSERLLRGTVLSLFCVPLIIIAPILAAAFGVETAKIMLAAIGVYFPTLIGVYVGLLNIDATMSDVIRISGGNRWDLLLKVQLRAAIPGLLAGLRLAAPAAILGAILAEFLGAERGLGVYIVGVYTQGNTALLWAISLVAATIAMLAYGLFAALGARFTAENLANELSTGGTAPEVAAALGWQGRGQASQWLVALGSLATTLLAWHILAAYFINSPIVGRGPLDVFHYLITHPNAAETRSAIGQALGVTLPLTLAGLVIGVGWSFAAAVLASVLPKVSASLLPITLVLQSTPFVILIPLFAILFGRDTTTTIIVTVAVIFFPSFVIITQGLAQVSPAALDLMRVYNASKLTTLFKVSVPSAIPYLFAAIRLSVPRALLAVALAEYLITFGGLGGELLRARGRLNFQMMWTIAAIAVAISVTLYIWAAAAERRARLKYGGESG